MSSQIEDEWVEVHGMKIHYLRSGNSGSPVLLLHGGALDSAYVSYKYSIGPISKRHTVFAPDLPGYGTSDRPDVEYTNDFFIDFIGGLMDTLGLKRASLVGLSVTGASAIGFTLESPQRVDKLIIADSYGLGGAMPYGLVSYFLVQTPFLLEARWTMFGVSPLMVRLGLRDIFYDPKMISDEVVEEVYRLARRPHAARAWISFQRSEFTPLGLKTDYTERLKDISTPTLIIHCAQDDLVPVKWAKRSHELIKDSRLKVIQGCSHWPQREKPDKFNRVVLQFLDGSISDAIA